MTPFRLSFALVILNVFVLCCNSASVYPPLTFYQDESSIHVYAGNLTLQIDRSPWRLHIYNNFTSKLFFEESTQDNKRLGFGIWEGKYLNFYEGYLLRIGNITEWYPATNASLHSSRHNEGGYATSVTIKVDSKTNDYILVTFFGFEEWTFSMSANVSTNKYNRVGWGYLLQDDDEQFYGFGERFNGVGQRGHVVGSWTEDGGWDIGKFDPTGKIRIPKGELSTYFPMPQFISSKNYALQLNTWYRSQFDSKTLKNHHHILVETNVLNITLIFGKSFEVTFGMLATFNGRSLIPPKWAFGPWNQLGDEVNGVSIVDRAKKLLFNDDIPFSMCVNPVHYFPEGGGRSDAESLRKMNDQLLSFGIKSTAYFNSMISQDWTEGYTEAVQKNLVLKTQSGLPYNYSYIGASFTIGLYKSGNSCVVWSTTSISGWMYDYGEYTPADSVSHDGSDGLLQHNKFPIDYQRTCHDYLVDKFGNRSSDFAPDFVFYVRSGYLGSSAVTWAHWTGDPSSDWSKVSGLPAQISASLSIGLSGIPFSGSDIGGFEWYVTSPPTMELWARWTQLGCFSGLMHEQGNGKGLVAKTHIFDTPEGTRIWRKFAKLRMQLFPYIYTMANFYRKYYGFPLMRHHIFDFQYDSAAIKQEYQYMFGDSLLAAPVITEGALKWNVYLPKINDLGNNWINFFSSSKYDEKDGRFRIGYNEYLKGGNWYTVDAPIDEIPLFVKAGSIIVAQDPRVKTLSKGQTSFSGKVMPSFESLVRIRHIWCWALIDRYFNAVTEIYDGSMYFLEPSNNAMCEFQTLSVPKQVTHVVQIAGPWAHTPMNVTVAHGAEIPKSANLNDLISKIDKNNTSEWIYDDSLNTLWIKMAPSVTHVLIN